MTARIVIAGAGGHGRGILEILVAAQERGDDATVEGFLDDTVVAGTTIAGIPVLGPLSRAAELASSCRFLLGIGDSRARAAVAARLSAHGVRYHRAIHPAATLYRDVQVEDGAVVAAGVVVAAASHLGPHTLLNLNATLGHDCRMATFATVGPGGNIGGHVTLEEGAFVGINGTVLPGRSLGAWSTVGAGSVLLEDLPPGATAFGVPGRIVHRTGEGR
ncbi:MAG: NeuD/PglB/VioB family sugar acetyltransferase [Candidatus Eisenbacteria bacterium]|uniref:NeuD/PglB/VioB family sugar acetyltransferase n=1 Tax=Eiseniibacteriota bacterium TaxID=2212470 RepID=A0A956RR04_UNCEI|nr:NeuD/PglB/VioB family sugar acetyltransferase [Candidatus Eisenbacteria bacterium]